MHQNVSIKLYLKIKAMKRIIIAKAQKSNSTLVKLKLEYMEHRLVHGYNHRMHCFRFWTVI
jgi:hypothetical protein